ncbi:hypothetical protein [Hymenobacter elongatus]|uniref:Uncharacterized protein n=1 Tax=Hymenobacter elongatus TaxID=877208 RepID=A0A4Z0PG73_9BACT|nr:hypothetical protein [Hymenobacter elongatus]TGE13489.1 hypothetical protein E5J99_19050 [Hymenobacter elongatus]
MAPTSLLVRAMVIGLAMLHVSCEKDTTVTPRQSHSPVVTSSSDNQDNGAYVAKNYFQVGMCACLTGLAAPLDMTQSNYVETSSGNRTSVWTGPVPASLMPPLTLDAATGISSFTYISFWNGDGDGIYYDSKCVVTADGAGGGTATLTLHAKKLKK